jgi:hypothetical protein
MENEDWDPALVQLRRSFELRPAQVALFNIGLCLKSLHRYQEAIAAFEHLLRDFATVGSEERRALARTEIQNMRALFGSARITVSAPGAEVLVDGTVVGVSPLTGPIELVGGTHTIAARRDGFEPARGQVEVVAGETATVELELRAVSSVRTANAPAPREPIENAPAGPEPQSEREPPGRGPSPVWFWSAATLTGVAAIATGVLSAIVIAGSAEYEESDPRTFDDQETGKRMMRLTDIALGVTVLAAAAAIVLYTQTDFHGGPAGDGPAGEVARASSVGPTVTVGTSHIALGVGGGF